MDNYVQLVEVNPEVILGKPAVQGTRITVKLPLDNLGVVRIFEELFKSYPNLQIKQI